MRIWLSFWRDLMLLTAKANAPLPTWITQKRSTPWQPNWILRQPAAVRCVGGCAEEIDLNLNQRLLVRVTCWIGRASCPSIHQPHSQQNNGAAR
jgi:hypothetical protein